MRVVLYSRVSTQEQASSGVSLDAQNEKLSGYAKLFDLEVVTKIEDAGESAKSLKRPGLEQALEMLRAGEADGIVVTKLDRLTRNVGDWQKLINEFFGDKAGKSLYSIGDSIDTTTAAGRLVLNVLLSVAQWEREAIGERTRDALQHKKSRGERLGASRYGYSVDEDTRELVVHENQLRVLDLIVELRRTMTLREIAAELTRRGIRTKKGKAKWNHNSVAGILKRGRYDDPATAQGRGKR